MKLTKQQEADIIKLINDESAQEGETYLSGVTKTLKVLGIRIPN